MVMEFVVMEFMVTELVVTALLAAELRVTSRAGSDSSSIGSKGCSGALCVTMDGNDGATAAG
jgi:hypothetical protein